VAAPPAAGEVAEALGSLLVDPSRRRALAARGRARFEASFTVDAWVRRLRKVYEAAIANGPRR